MRKVYKKIFEFLKNYSAINWKSKMVKSFENLSDIEDYDKPWWVDYDGDIEEERRKIIERVSEIEDPEKRQEKYEELLNAIEYNEYYAYNPHMKSESYLIDLRNYDLKEHEDEDIDEFIEYILNYSHMESVGAHSIVENVLIVNVNKKFTFLNSIKTLDEDKITEKGKIKMRREYGDEWREDDEEIYVIVFVKSY